MIKMFSGCPLNQKEFDQKPKRI